MDSIAGSVPDPIESATTNGMNNTPISAPESTMPDTGLASK